MAVIVNDAYWVSNEDDYWGPRTLECGEDGVGCDGFFEYPSAHSQCFCSCHDQDDLQTMDDVVKYHQELHS